MLSGSVLPPAKIIAINEPFYCRVKKGWSEVGIKENSEYLIQPGPTFCGDIIALRYYGQRYLCWLANRDYIGNIRVRCRDHSLVDLEQDTFTIEGRLVLSSQRPIVNQSEPALIVTDSLLSWRNDRSGSNVGISLKWVRLTGESPDAVKALGWLVSAHPDDRERVVRTRDAGIKSGELYFIDYRLRTLKGNYIPLHTYSAPIINNDGEITGWQGAAQIKQGG